MGDIIMTTSNKVQVKKELILGYRKDI